MESEIVESLNDIGYTGPLTDEEALVKALEGGPKSLAYTKLVHILAEELKQLCGLEETVNIINDVDDSSSFLLELSSFLKELGCPYKKLVTGHMSSRLQSKEDRLILLDYMLSELMAARMLNIDKPKDTSLNIVKHESNTARDLKNILISLKFNKPPPTITAEMLFNKLTVKLQETIQKEGDGLVGKPLYNKAMNEKQWKDLEALFTEMLEEYRLRRETLITRLECTIQSFEWSDRLKGKKELIQESYRPKREQMKFKPDISLSDFLAARTSLLHVEKTSSANVRRNTTSDVNKVIIGRVPDRGGRPNEQQPPPPEMPSWQQQRSQESVIIHDSESEPDCEQVQLVETIPSVKPKPLQTTPSTTKKKKNSSQKRRDKKKNQQEALEKKFKDLKRGLDEKVQKEDDVNCKRLRTEELSDDVNCKRVRAEELSDDINCKKNSTEELSDDVNCKRVRTEELSLETLTGINLAIVTDNYPAVKLQQEDYIELRELLFTLLEEKEPCPDIHINRAAGGFVLVICTDLYSAKWLLDLNHIKLKSLTLKVIEMDDLPRPVKMAWRSVYTGQIDLKRILGLIQKLNPTVHTELWRVVDTLTEGLNVIRIILVDLESAEVIRGKGFCLKAGLEGNFFKILEEPEANKDTLMKELTFIDLEQDDLIKKSVAGENGLTGGGRGGGFGGDRGGRGDSRGGRGGRGDGRGGRGGGRVQGGFNQGQNDNRSNQRMSYQTYEVPPGGYQQNQPQHNNHSKPSAYDSMGNYGLNSGSYGNSVTYGQNSVTYTQNTPSFGQNSGGYGQDSGSYGQSSGGYGQSSGNRGGFNQNQGGYNKGFQSQPQPAFGQSGYQNRGGYQNEHDDRLSDRSDRSDQRGRSNYNRGGRR